MRRLSCVAVVLAAMSLGACGSPAPEAGNSYVTESALGIVEGVVDGDGTVRLVAVTIDVNDPGCSVDGLRYDRCTFTQTATADYDGPLNLCELAVSDETTYVWECEISDTSDSHIDHLEELPVHCPTSGR